MFETVRLYYNRVGAFARRKPVCSFFIVYTLLFAAVFSVISLAFLRQDKLFLGLGDGPDQLYPAFYYTGSWLKEIVSNIFHGNFELPMWSFEMGMGSDIIASLHYYAIGDPFSLLTLFVPQSCMEIFYYFIVCVKFYCFGLAFSAYCRYMKIGWFETVTGSLLYTFSGYCVVFFLPMIIFGNAIIYLPLLCLGLEKILRKEKPHLFVVMTAVSAFTNFYFFYMLTILTFLYGIIRYFFSYRSSKVSVFFKTAGKAVGFYLTGAAMGAFLFLPVISAYLNSSRAGSTALGDIGLFYGGTYYKEAFTGFMTISKGNNYTVFAFAAISVFAIVYLFTHKGKSFWQLRSSFILLTAAMLLPVGGWIFNGFGYPVNRWMFGYVFLICLITVSVLPKLYRASGRTIPILGAFLFLYFTACVLLYSNDGGAANAYTFIGLFLGAFVLFAMAYFGMKPGGIFVKTGILLLTCVHLALNGFLIYDAHYLNGVSGYETIGSTQSNYFNGFGAVAAKLPESAGFSRLTCNRKTYANDSIINGYHAYTSYWSIQNKNVFDLYRDQDIGLHFLHYYYDFGHDPYLLALTSAEYSILGTGDANPLYGYEEIESPQAGFGAVSRNQYHLPLAFTYDSGISAGAYNRLQTMDKKRMLLQSVVMETPYDFLQSAENFQNMPPVPYTVIQKENVVSSEHEIQLRNGAHLIELAVDIPKGRSVYLSFENLHFDHTSWFSFTNGHSVQFLHYLNPDFLYYYGNHDFTISLGKNDVDVDSVVIDTGLSGTLRFDALNIYVDDMQEYTESVAERLTDPIDDITAAGNHFSACVTVENKKALFMSIPYSEGWTAKVNSREVGIEKANLSFMAIPLEEGENKIELYYRTPGLAAGCIISAAAIAGYAAVCLILKRRGDKKVC